MNIIRSIKRGYRWAAEKLDNVCDWLRSKWARVAASVGLALGGAALTQAQTAPATPAFDYTTFSGLLMTGLTVVGSVAAGIAAIAAGVLVWKKIKSYFGKAG